LVARGVIDEKQLKQALETQMICGGHLGTCLMELGYVDEHLLGRILAELLGVRYAHPGLFHNIAPEVIATIPAPMVERLKVIPINMKGRLLQVAMVEPKNLPALDELSFVTSCRVESWLAPEARIFEAMERYYEIPRRMRYISLCQQMDSEETRPAAEKTQVATAAVGGAGPIVDAVPIPEPGPSEVSGAIVLPSSSRGAVRSAGAGRRPVATDTSPETPSLEEALCRAETVDEIAQVVIERVAEELRRAVLFMIKGPDALIWHSHGLGLDRERMQGLTFPVVDEPVFALPIGDPCYRGLVPGDPVYSAFFRKLGIERPTEVLIVPAHFNDRLVAILYGDGGTEGRVHGSAEQYLRIMQQLSLTLNLLAIKKKIRSI